MSEEPTVARLTQLCRDFMGGLRQTIAEAPTDAIAEQRIEDIFAVVATLGAAAMMLLPIKRNEKLIAALLSAALRFLTRRRKAVA